MRLLLSILGLVLVVAPARSLFFPHGAESARQALWNDAASPYRWARNGEALQEAGDIEGARRCFRRALELAPRLPQIWMRAANFYLFLDEPAEMARCGARVLKMVPDYDEIIFSYFDRLALDTGLVLSRLEDSRAGQSYLRHLVATRNLSAARPAWAWLAERGWADDRIASDYVDFLLREGEPRPAVAAWAAYLGSRAKGYPASEALFNGSFYNEPSGCAFDWRITPVEGVEAVREAGALRLRFLGSANVAYDHAVQAAYVSPGVYRLSASVRTENLTTNEGIALRVYDAESPGRLDARTGALLGTNDWTQVTQKVVVPPGTRLLMVRIVRNASLKFDNQIGGTAWISGVSLAASPGVSVKR